MTVFGPGNARRFHVTMYGEWDVKREGAPGDAATVAVGAGGGEEGKASEGWSAKKVLEEMRQAQIQGEEYVAPITRSGCIGSGEVARRGSGESEVPISRPPTTQSELEELLLHEDNRNLPAEARAEQVDGITK